MSWGTRGKHPRLVSSWNQTFLPGKVNVLNGPLHLEVLSVGQRFISLATSGSPPKGTEYFVQGGNSMCHNDDYKIRNGPAPMRSTEPEGNQYYGEQIIWSW